MVSATRSTQKAATSTTAGTKRKPFTPGPPRPIEERLPKLYRGLTDQVDEGHFANAIKTCKKILALDPTSKAAFQTLLFLHLQTDDYNSAITLLDNPPSSISLDFERAYCLYRLHREKEALDALTSSSASGRKQLHLEAQIRYRMGDFDRAQQIYDQLLADCDSSSPEHPDVLENISATSAHLDFNSHGYHTFLNAPPPTNTAASSQKSHIPTEADLESYVPSLPSGWAIGGVAHVKKAPVAAPPKKVEDDSKKRKRKHKLPKGASESKPFNGDPDRWLPARQRASFVTAMSKKKGQNLSMGTGMTQGSTTSAANSGGAGGGGKKKKGKK